MRIHSASCLLFLKLYLKQCKIVLQKVFGCDSRESLSVFVALTRSGYARIIPALNRQIMRRRDDRADRVVCVLLVIILRVSTQ